MLTVFHTPDDTIEIKSDEIGQALNGIKDVDELTIQLSVNCGEIMQYSILKQDFLQSNPHTIPASNTVIVFPSDYNLKEFRDGIYLVRVIFLKNGKSCDKDEEVLFVNAKLKCDIIEYLGKNIDDAQAAAFYYILANAKGCYCVYNKMCNLMKWLKEKIYGNCEEPAKSGDCGCK